MKLDEFKELRKFLLSEYDVLLAEKLISADVAVERKDNFKKERFIVSVCGQIKAGKSTLLNALLFGKEILPSDDTPHTAKLTMMDYAETPYFEAVFYTADEWREVKNSCSGDKNFVRDCNCAVEKGVHPAEVLGQKQKINDLSLLKEYVAAVDKDGYGVYTPYVKYVQLFYPAELLRDITIVDTPGTNDPNIIRSNVTHDWVNKSHAVIYAMYANQAFDTADDDFINSHLLGISRSHLLYAVNKIDAVKSMAELDAWISEVADSEKYKGRAFFEDRSSIQKVCSLGGLFLKMEENGEQIPHTYSFDYNGLRSKGYLSDKNGMLALSELMQERIIKTKGSGLLKAEASFIEGEYKKKTRAFKDEIAKNEYELMACSKTKEELSKRIEELSINADKLKTDCARTDKELMRISVDSMKTRNMQIEKMIKDVKSNIERELGNCNSLNQIKSNIRGILSSELRMAKSKIYDVVSMTNSTLKEELEKIKNELKRTYGDLFDVFQGPCDDAFDALEKMFFELKERADSKLSVENVIKENTSWWGRLWGTRTAIADARFAVLSVLLDQSEKVIENYMKDVTVSIKGGINKISKDLGTITDNKITEVINKLKQYNNSSDTQSQIKKKIEDSIKKIENDILRIKDIQSAFGKKLQQRDYNNV